MLRSFAAVVAVAVVAAPLFADDKIDAAKLVGGWKEGSPKDPIYTVTEFAKDNSVTRKVTIEGKTTTMKGTWKLDGTKLTATYPRAGGKKSEQVAEVVSVSDKELQLKVEGSTVKLERLKEETKKDK